MAESDTVERAAKLRPRRRIGIVAGVVGAALLLALLGAAAGAGWFYVAARAALPQLDGTIPVAGISGQVTIIRDRQGVPHIKADNLEDLFFAQGYVTAQDRLWQMDVMRRYAGGELAEIMGETLLEHDRRQRILGLNEAALRAFGKLEPRERRFLDTYARGVNASMNAAADNLPLEFRVLRYEPRAWRAEDSLLLAAYMCQMLNHYNFDTEIAREKVYAKLGPQLAPELYPSSSSRDRPPVAAPGPGTPQPESSRTLPLHRTSLIPWPQSSDLVPGSNNWVVSGAHTTTSKPLLANDMHLGHQMPNLWYETHLESGGFNVAGVTLPGTPFVIVGHTQRIAWGFTNLGPDVEDIYIESFNQKGEYRTPDGWRHPELRREVIRVKGKPDVAVEVLTTRHGPVVTELVPGETRRIALRWTLYDPGALAIPFFQVNAARNWEEFRRAFSRFGAPGQNVVYADVDGHIGYQATGFIPVRNGWDGSAPVAGDDDTYDWKGYVPFDELPSVLDPPSGILATANGRITPDGYPRVLATQWDSPFRTERIYRLLEQGGKIDVADMLRIQTDTWSGHDLFLAQAFARALDGMPSASARAKEAGALLKQWDGFLNTDAVAPSIVAAARRQLMRLILEPRLGNSWTTYRWFMSSIWLENTLRNRLPQWLPGKYVNYDELLAAALEETLRDRSAPERLADWRWGRQSPVVIEHPIFSRIPVLQRWAAPGLQEQSGGARTVKQVGRNFGPSERMTVDLADLDRSTLNVVTGQSGHLLSPHYMDQWALWYEGRTVTLPFSSAAVAQARAHELTLVPEGTAESR